MAGTVRALRNAFFAPREGEILFIAEEGNGEQAGFIYVVTRADFFKGEPVAHISEIAVSQDGAGAERNLMGAAEEWAASRNSRYVSLNVHTGNDRARSFYEHLGYDLEWQHFNKQLR